MTVTQDYKIITLSDVTLTALVRTVRARIVVLERFIGGAPMWPDVESEQYWKAELLTTKVLLSDLSRAVAGISGEPMPVHKLIAACFTGAEMWQASAALAVHMDGAMLEEQMAAAQSAHDKFHLAIQVQK